MIRPPALANTYQEVPGLDGSKLQYTTFSRYQVVANFCLFFTDWQDYKLAKHQFYRLFTSRQQIRMRTDVESSIVRFVYPNLPEIKPDQNGSHYATFSMNFDNPSDEGNVIDIEDTPEIKASRDLVQGTTNAPSSTGCYC